VQHTDSGPPGREPALVAGLFASLNNFLATLVAIGHTRLQLLTTELQEEVREVGQILVWSFVALFAAMMALFLGALTVIFVFWDSHRILAALLMTGAFLLIAALSGLMLMRRLAAKPPLLDDTLAELAKDRDQLRARL
jgi:uncharacterized membrane protein YqjE